MFCFVVSGDQLLPKWISQDLQRKYSLWCCEAKQSWLHPYSFGLWVTTEYPEYPQNVHNLCQGGCNSQSRRFLLQSAGIGCRGQFCWNTCHLCWAFEAEPSQDQGQAVDADDQVWGRKRGIGGPLQETVGITPPAWGNFAFDSLCLWVFFHTLLT